MDDVKNQDIAEYFVAQSWTMLDWVKFIVEHAIDNPSSNLEARLHDMMYKGVSKTLAEINRALDANKTISEETKAAYRRDFQSYLKELKEWMYAAYRSKTLLYPQYKYLETQQQMLFERLPEMKAGYKGRKYKSEKIAAISAYLLRNPHATSRTVGEATGIDESDVRRLWGDIKRNMKEGKRIKPTGVKRNGRIEAVDQSASCKICKAPLSASFHCTCCEEIIVGECNMCHYTNNHPDKAVP